MAKRLRVGNAMLCEHVVPGANNKHSIINLYSGDVIIWSSLPTAIMFGLYVEFLDDLPGILDVEMRLDGKMFASFKAEFPVASGTPYILTLPLFQLGVDRDLTFDVIAKAEGFAATKVISKRITQGQGPTPISATGSWQPSEQSPPGAPPS